MEGAAQGGGNRRTAGSDRKAVEHAHGGDHHLLGHQSGEQGHRRLPGAEAQGGEQGSQEAAHEAQDRGLLVGHHAEGPALKAERLEEPEQHTHGQNQGARLHQEALYLLPHVEGDIFEGGQAVGGQLQHEGGGLSLENQLLEEDARADGEEQAQQIEGKYHQPSVLGEEGGGEQAVHRQPGGAGHKGNQHDGHAAVLLVLHGAGSHDCRDGAAEAHEHGDKRLAGQSEAPQQPVHNEGRPGHVA